MNSDIALFAACCMVLDGRAVEARQGDGCEEEEGGGEEWGKTSKFIVIIES